MLLFLAYNCIGGSTFALQFFVLIYIDFSFLLFIFVAGSTVKVLTQIITIRILSFDQILLPQMSTLVPSTREYAFYLPHIAWCCSKYTAYTEQNIFINF